MQKWWAIGESEGQSKKDKLLAQKWQEHTPKAKGQRPQGQSENDELLVPKSQGLIENDVLLGEYERST